jgi:hypothetical protein
MLCGDSKLEKESRIRILTSLNHFIHKYSSNSNIDLEKIYKTVNFVRNHKLKSNEKTKFNCNTMFANCN